MMDQEVLNDFVAEAREHLETIEPKLLELEKNPQNLQILDDIFRPMHSLKGASGFLHLNAINGLAHKSESVLDELRKGRIENNSEIMDVILTATDALCQMLDNLEQAGDEGQVDTSGVEAQLESFIQGTAPPPASKSGGQRRPQGQKEAKQKQPQPSQPGSGSGSYALTVNSPDHLSDFLEEARDIVSSLNDCLLKLEKGSENPMGLVQDAFRYFHNLKGNSGLIGYSELNSITHKAETLLNECRQSEVTPESSTVDHLLQAVDIIETMLEAIDQSSGEVSPPDSSSVSRDLDRIMAGLASSLDQGKAYESQGADDEEQEAPLQAGRDNAFDSEDLSIFRQTVEQQLDNVYLALRMLTEDASQSDYVDGMYRSFLSLRNASEYMGLEETKVYAERTANLVDQGRSAEQGMEMLLPILQQETEILENMLHSAMDKALDAGPAEPDSQPEDRVAGSSSKDSPEKVSASEQGAQAQAEEAEQEPEMSPSVPAASEELQEEGREKQPSKADASKSSAKVSTTIRVEHEKLDHLMNLIGELIINRNRFSLLTKELEAGKDISDVVQNLSETTDSMARISDDLQDTIMQVRMVPMRTVFSRFPRLVRDLSRKSGKNIELITEGEDTELDKSVIEAIGDPLVHLIRNAVDHGQEQPEERKRAGKPQTGHVWLKAYHEGNSVVIVIADDGKGIDPEKVKQKAVSKGIISEEEAAKLEDKEATELIFAPGFSTSEEVTDVSGRGVGMDVVKNNIKNLNGSVAVQSEVGRGTSISLSLPLTLAIIEALLVKVGHNTFAIPLDAVSETTKIPAKQVKEVNKRWATTLRGEVLGIEDLSRVLGLGNGSGSKEVYPLVVISVNDRRVGLIVDALLHRQEIVIKSMGEYLGEVHGLSGATIMGDGSVILILDPSEIMSMTISRNG